MTKTRPGILAATICSCLLTALGTSAAGSKKAAAPASEEVRITKVRFVSEYRMLNATATAKPGGLIAVVETNRKFNQGDITAGLSNYVFQFTYAGDKTDSLPAVAVGCQTELMGGSMLQLWLTEQNGLIDGVAPPSQYISGLTLLGLMPDTVTSFTVSIKSIGFVSNSIQREPAKESLAKE